MKRKGILLFIPTILLLIVSACTNSLQQVEPTSIPTTVPTKVPQPVSTFPKQTLGNIPSSAEGVTRIMVEQARTAFEAGSAIIVDVRSPDAYAASHIKGAVNIPLGDIELNTIKVPLQKDQWIITYCT